MGAGGSRVVAGGARAVVVPLLLLLLLLAGSAAPDWTDCPEACRCKWTSGKKTALCPNADLSTVPTALNPDMQVLDLTGNKIPNLPASAFAAVGLLNLQRIFVKSSGLREVHRDAFKDLRILIEVDLSDNDIASLHQDTFAGNERLRVVCLSGNPLSELRSYQFPPLPHLRTLDFGHCRLEHIDEEALVHLTTLESVNLKGNRLRHLSERVFAPLTKMKTLALDGNPWGCDCHLRSFRQWLLASKLYSLPLVCEEPEPLAGKPWEEVAAADFACGAHVVLADKMIQQEAGGNVTFHCRVTGDPEPEVTWYFNGRPVGGNGSAFGADTIYSVDQEDGQGLLEKWSNISVYNVSDTEAGEYGCQARNLRGKDAARATLTLPVVVTATTLSKAESWLLWAGLATGGVSAVVALLVAVVCSCCFCGARRGRKRHRRKCNLKVSQSRERELHRPREEVAGPEHHHDGDGATLAGRAVLHRQQGGAGVVAGPGAAAAAAARPAPAHHHREPLGEHGRVPAATRVFVQRAAHRCVRQHLHLGVREPGARRGPRRPPGAPGPPGPLRPRPRRHGRHDGHHQRRGPRGPRGRRGPGGGHRRPQALPGPARVPAPGHRAALRHRQERERGHGPRPALRAHEPVHAQPGALRHAAAPPPPQGRGRHRGPRPRRRAALRQHGAPGDGQRQLHAVPARRGPARGHRVLQGQLQGRLPGPAAAATAATLHVHVGVRRAVNKDYFQISEGVRASVYIYMRVRGCE